MTLARHAAVLLLNLAIASAACIGALAMIGKGGAVAWLGGVEGVGGMLDTYGETIVGLGPTACGILCFVAGIVVCSGLRGSAKPPLPLAR